MGQLGLSVSRPNNILCAYNLNHPYLVNPYLICWFIKTGIGDDDDIDQMEIDLTTNLERHVTTNLTDIEGDSDSVTSDSHSDGSPCTTNHQ